jgi:hypothetical protein
MELGRLVVVLLLAASAVSADTPSGTPDSEDEPDAPIAAAKSSSTPVISREDSKPKSVDWQPLFFSSFKFLLIENGWRYVTEEATRHPHLPFFKGYVDSVTNLHGWTDGNPNFDNYVGHPMQGGVAGFIWAENDRRFHHVEFGRNSEYWKSRLRAAAFMWAYSEMEEIGPFSEASIGNIQAKPPEQGFVDHVITPTLGLAWMIGEDALDRYVIRKLERKTSNRTYQAIIRGTMNPTRSFANVIGGRWPWARTTDEYNLYRSAPRNEVARPPHREMEPRPGVAPLEVTMSADFFNSGNGPCIGGGANAAFRVHPQWQIVGNLNGCNMTGLAANHNGGSMIYTAGARWTPMLPGRWHLYVQLLAGGNKVTEDIVLPEQKAALELKAKKNSTPLPDQSQYTLQFDSAGSALTAGTGLDFQVNNALAIRLLSVDYTKTWAQNMPSFAAPRGWMWKTGVVLRMGTW